MAIFSSKPGGTKVGNLIRSVAQSPIASTAIGVYSPKAGAALSAVNKSAQNTTQNISPGPQYTPTKGIGTVSQQGGYVYGKSGWEPNTGLSYTPVPGGPLAYTPVPKGSVGTSSTTTSGNTAPVGSNNGGNSGANYGGTANPMNEPAPSTYAYAPAAKVAAPAISGTGGGSVAPASAKTGTATAGELIAGNVYNYNLTPEEKAIEEGLRRSAEINNKISQDNLDQKSIYQDTLAQFQGEIDAANQIYAEKLAEAKRQGQSRLGTTRAENFNAGIVNSSFGNAAQEATQKYNTGIEGDIQAQKLKTISEIQGRARELGNKFYTEKKAARDAGLTDYIANLNSIKEKKTAIAGEIGAGMLTSGIDPNKITEEQLAKIASNAGVTAQQIKSAYATSKAAAAAAEAKLAFNLSEGQARYDSKGNIIAQRAKTYKAGTGTGFGGTNVSEAALNFAKQIQSGAATLAQVPSAMRAEVSTALMQLPSQKVQELDQVINLIDELSSNKKLNNITGPADQFIGGVFGQAAVAKNIYNQLQGVLALEGRSKLKGSGAISDFEFKVLKDAQSALGRNLPASALRAELEKVKGILTKRRNTLISQGFVGDTSVGDTESEATVTGQEEQVSLPDGTILTLQPDGTYE